MSRHSLSDRYRSTSAPVPADAGGGQRLVELAQHRQHVGALIDQRLTGRSTPRVERVVSYVRDALYYDRAARERWGRRSSLLPAVVLASGGRPCFRRSSLL